MKIQAHAQKIYFEIAVDSSIRDCKSIYVLFFLSIFFWCAQSMSICWIHIGKQHTDWKCHFTKAPIWIHLFMGLGMSWSYVLYAKCTHTHIQFSISHSELKLSQDPCTHRQQMREQKCETQCLAFYSFSFLFCCSLNLSVRVRLSYYSSHSSLRFISYSILHSRRCYKIVCRCRFSIIIHVR